LSSVLKKNRGTNNNLTKPTTSYNISALQCRTFCCFKWKPVSLVLSRLHASPALENDRSLLADVSGMLKYLAATKYNVTNCSFLISTSYMPNVHQQEL